MDVEAIRACFPALQRRHNGVPVAYFDGPGGTQVPQVVVDAMADYLLHHNANTAWAYPTSAETDAAIEGGRQALADYLGGAADEIVFGANMTSLTLHVGRSLGRGWAARDELIVTELDHHANVDPWRELAKERGLTVHTVPMDPATGELELDGFERVLGPRTKLVAIGAASNALGTITDVRSVADRAHAVGALVYVDAVHYAAHLAVDPHELGADVVACSPYKFYGPHLGALWARRDLIEAIDAPVLVPAHHEAPYRLETGTLSHEAIVGAGAAVDFIASWADGEDDRRARLCRATTEAHDRSSGLLRQLWDGLATLPGITVYGPPPGRPRTPTVSFAVAGHDPRAVTAALAERGVFVTHGDFYATTVVARLGHADDGLVRVGCAAYTTPEEIDRLLEELRALTS